MNLKEQYLNEIVKYAFLIQQDFAKDARERAELQDRIKLVAPSWSVPTLDEKPVFCSTLKFTDKEISKMPKSFRKEFRVDGRTVSVRKRCDGRYKCSYEIRYRRDGYNISVSARTKEEAKEKFIIKLQTTAKMQTAARNVPTTFREFALFWLENFHKRKVAANTYKEDVAMYRRHLHDRFDGQVKNINAKQLQDYLDEFVAAGKGRTAESVHYLLKQIFAAAVQFELIARNPMEIVIREKHEREHGAALTLEEEKLLLSASAGTRYQLYFAVALYTGLRPNEYKTVEIRGDMIVARNSKRKRGAIAYKRIPIIKMLRPYLEGVQTIKWVKEDYIRAKFKEILPNHTLKDLRKTFYTHCETCGVAESARDEMVGHDSGVLKTTYTDLPDEFLLQEAEKLVW